MCSALLSLTHLSFSSQWGGLPSLYNPTHVALSSLITPHVTHSDPHLSSPLLTLISAGCPLPLHCHPPVPLSPPGSAPVHGRQLQPPQERATAPSQALSQHSVSAFTATLTSGCSLTGWASDVPTGLCAPQGWQICLANNSLLGGQDAPHITGAKKYLLD